MDDKSDYIKKALGQRDDASQDLLHLIMLSTMPKEKREKVEAMTQDCYLKILSQAFTLILKNYTTDEVLPLIEEPRLWATYIKMRLDMIQMTLNAYIDDPEDDTDALKRRIDEIKSDHLSKAPALKEAVASILDATKTYEMHQALSHMDKLMGKPRKDAEGEKGGSKP